MTIPLWQGKEVYLFGNGWEDYIKILPAPANVKVTILHQAAQWRKLQEESGRSERKLLSIIEGVGSEGTSARYEQGILYYDEIMILTFFFSYVIHPGNRNPDARFLLIDGRFYITGMFAIWDRVFAAARYAIAKGYIPIFMIVSADSSMYSDHEGDDIWNKFFLQPSGYALEEVLQSSYLALSPNTFLVKNTLRRIMDEISAGYELLCPGEVFNEQVKAYIRERQRIFLPCPERTLGVMIRGTDYIHNPFPNHAKQATAEQVIQKIAEVEGEWEFDWIYLATEDADVCLRMKEEYGERILFTVCTINLLAQCSSLIASGGCCGLTETLRENEGRYRNIYIFELGTT